MANVATGNSDMASGVNILNVNEHQVIDELYSYRGGFRDGTYLIPHIMETTEKFAKRCQSSHLVNFYSPVIDAMWRPVFDKQIKRICDDPVYNEFLINVDNKGTGIEIFMRGTARETRKHSTYFVVMDNFSEVPPTENEMIRNRAYPYLYKKKPQDVESYELDRYGNLVSITFRNGVYVEMVDGKKKEYQKFIEMTPETFDEYYIVKDGDKSAKVSIEGFPKVNAIGEVPVVIARDEHPDDGELMAPPRTYGLMRINHAIFNKDSEMRENERKQQFSMAVFKGAAKDQVIGTSNGMFIPQDADFPQYLEPNPAILSGLRDNRTDLRDDAYRIAEQTGVVGTKTLASGTAMGFEFMPRASVLSETAAICESVEYAICKLFQMWTNRTFDFVVEYSREYTPSDETAMMKVVDIALTYADIMPPDVMIQAARFIVSKLYPTATEEELSLIDSTMRLSIDAKEKAYFDARNAVLEDDDAEDDADV